MPGPTSPNSTNAVERIVESKRREADRARSQLDTALRELFALQTEAIDLQRQQEKEQEREESLTGIVDLAATVERTREEIASAQFREAQLRFMLNRAQQDRVAEERKKAEATAEAMKARQQLQEMQRRETDLSRNLVKRKAEAEKQRKENAEAVARLRQKLEDKKQELEAARKANMEFQLQALITSRAVEKGKKKATAPPASTSATLLPALASARASPSVPSIAGMTARTRHSSIQTSRSAARDQVGTGRRGSVLSSSSSSAASSASAAGLAGDVLLSPETSRLLGSVRHRRLRKDIEEIEAIVALLRKAGVVEAPVVVQTAEAEEEAKEEAEEDGHGVDHEDEDENEESRRERRRRNDPDRLYLSRLIASLPADPSSLLTDHIRRLDEDQKTVRAKVAAEEERLAQLSAQLRKLKAAEGIGTQAVAAASSDATLSPKTAEARAAAVSAIAVDVGFLEAARARRRSLLGNRGAGSSKSPDRLPSTAVVTSPNSEEADKDDQELLRVMKETELDEEATLHRAEKAEEVKAKHKEAEAKERELVRLRREAGRLKEEADFYSLSVTPVRTGLSAIAKKLLSGVGGGGSTAASALALTGTGGGGSTTRRTTATETAATATTTSRKDSSCDSVRRDSGAGLTLATAEEAEETLQSLSAVVARMIDEVTKAVEKKKRQRKRDEGVTQQDEEQPAGSFFELQTAELERALFAAQSQQQPQPRQYQSQQQRQPKKSRGSGPSASSAGVAGLASLAARDSSGLDASPTFVSRFNVRVPAAVSTSASLGAGGAGGGGRASPPKPRRGVVVTPAATGPAEQPPPPLLEEDKERPATIASLTASLGGRRASTIAAAAGLKLATSKSGRGVVGGVGGGVGLAASLSEGALSRHRSSLPVERKESGREHREEGGGEGGREGEGEGDDDDDLRLRRAAVKQGAQQVVREAKKAAAVARRAAAAAAEASGTSQRRGHQSPTQQQEGGSLPLSPGSAVSFALSESGELGP